jgi:hypothetical protein
MAHAATAAAHPPKEVRLEWNPSGELAVIIAHSVDNPGKHYVYRIAVYVDNKMAATRDYQSQASADGLTDVFSLGPLPSGTNLKAEAYCVIMGSTVGSTVVP